MPENFKAFFVKEIELLLISHAEILLKVPNFEARYNKFPCPGPISK